MCVEYNIGGFDINEFFFVSEDHELKQDLGYNKVMERLAGLSVKIGTKCIGKNEKLFRF
jgi:hypothetical protein